MGSKPTTEKIKTRTGQIACSHTPGRDAYCLVHGLGGWKEFFADAFGHPTAAELAVVCPDLLGFGSSARLGNGAAYSMALQAEAVVECVASLGFDRACFVLHSISSALLPALLGQRRASVESVCLLEGNLVEEDTEWSGKLAAMSDDEFDKYYSWLLQKPHLVLASQLRAGQPRDAVREWAGSFAHADPRALRQTAAEGYSLTVSGEIVQAVRGSKVPIQYIRGRDEREWNGAALLAELGVSVQYIKGAGHYMMLDQPEATYEIVFGKDERRK